METKLGMIIAELPLILPFELILPFNHWFCIVFLQIINAIVYQLAMIVFIPTPTEQFGLFEVFYVSPNNLCIHCSAPLFVSFQVNQPYFMIIFQHQNLLRTDHLNVNILPNNPPNHNFHFLPEQNLSVAVSVEKNSNQFSLFSLSTIEIALLSR